MGRRTCSRSTPLVTSSAFASSFSIEACWEFSRLGGAWGTLSITALCDRETLRLTGTPLPCAAAPFFCPFPPACPAAPGGSSRGTMSIKKSNWSDLLRALAISARDNVRRLLESAMMNARAVISAMKTTQSVVVSTHFPREGRRETDFHRPCRRVWELRLRKIVDGPVFLITHRQLQSSVGPQSAFHARFLGRVLRCAP